MGCISSKEASSSPRERISRKGSVDRRVAHVNSLKRDDLVRSKSKFDSGDVKVKLIDKKINGSSRLYDDEQIEKNQFENHRIEVVKGENFEVDVNSNYPQIEKKKKVEKLDVSTSNHPGSGRVPKCVEAEQIAAGWPSWLASTAGEAIKGWVPRRASTFEKLDRIGQGTYSNVYKARDVIHDKIVAIKKVRFDCHDPDSIKFMAREINILRRLDHPNIIKLEGLITSQTSSSLYLVFEYMEHDLTGLVSLPGVKFKEPQIKCYMQQLLSGLDHCHSRGVLHRDIKGSNLLVDDNGILKIADFGLATFFDPQNSAPLTSRVVTLWYRAPELLLGASHYGVSVDLWSAGCILGELYTGKPILPGRNEVEQLHKIFKLCGSPPEDYWKRLKLPNSSIIKPQRPYRRCLAEIFCNLPSPAIGLIDTLLNMDPADRGTAAFALRDKFFKTKPFACDPSCLPKYPPSKEIDAKMRDEEARRQETTGYGRKVTQQSVAGVAYKENSTMVQERRYSNANGRSDMFPSQKEKTVSGFLVDPSKQSQVTREGRREFPEHQRRKVSHSGPLVPAGWTKAGKELDNPNLVSARQNLSNISSLVASRTSARDDQLGKHISTSQTEIKQEGGRQESFNGVESMAKQYQSHQLRRPAESPQENGAKSTTREASLYGRGPRSGSKIYVSGPLLVPSNNVEQMLKEHDRKIQEYARKRIDKTKYGKGKQGRENLAYISKHSGR